MITVAQLIPLGLALAWLFTIPARGAEATVSGTSSSGAVEWSIDPTSGDLNLNTPRNGSFKKLCETFNAANVQVSFSPDDKYVIVSDGGPSLGIHCTLYKRNSGLSYSQVNDIDFDDAVTKLAMEVLYKKKNSDLVLDHSYLECTGWSKDGRRALLQFSGKGGPGGNSVNITGFKCSYDPASRVFSTGK